MNHEARHVCTNPRSSNSTAHEIPAVAGCVQLHLLWKGIDRKIRYSDIARAYPNCLPTLACATCNPPKRVVLCREVELDVVSHPENRNLVRSSPSGTSSSLTSHRPILHHYHAPQYRSHDDGYQCLILLARSYTTSQLA
eukprot:9488292-Pyramimonas_sp.AAC.1